MSLLELFTKKTVTLRLALGSGWATLAILTILTGCGSGGSGSVGGGTPMPTPANCGSSSPASFPTLSMNVNAETTWLADSQSQAWGFQYGPVDGTLGVLGQSGGSAKFFMAARPYGSSTGTFCG